MRPLIAALILSPIVLQLATDDPPKPGLPQPMPDPGEKSPLPAEKFPPNKLERAVIDRINEIRAAGGVGQLEEHQILTVTAAKHAKAMAAEDALSQEAGDMTFDEVMEGYPYTEAARLVVKAETPMNVTVLWLKSVSHRKKLVYADYREIGVATATSSDGTRYWAVILANPKPELKK